MSPAQSHHFFTPPLSKSKDQKEMKSNILEKEKEPEFQTSPPIHKSDRGHPSKFPKSAPVWILLGIGAIFYIGLVALGSKILPTQNKGVNDTAQIETKINSNMELELVNSQLEIVKKEITELKGTISDTNAQQRALAERVALMDNKFETTAAKVATLSEFHANPEKIKIVQDKGTNRNTSLSNKEISKSKKEDLAKQKELVQGSGTVKIINSAKAPSETQSIETSSVEPNVQPAASEKLKSAASAASSTNIGLQIATGPSLESLRLSWNFLSEKHSDNLKSLEPRYTKTLVDNQEVYNLLVGPVVSEDEAKKMCKDLGNKAIPCNIVKGFGGEAL